MLYHKGLRYCVQLDDTILKTIETAEQPELQQAREVVLRMRRRQLYQVHRFVYSTSKQQLGDEFVRIVCARGVRLQRVCSESA